MGEESYSNETQRLRQEDGFSYISESIWCLADPGQAIGCSSSIVVSRGHFYMTSATEGSKGEVCQFLMFSFDKGAGVG